jgi:N-carbamoylputrescine amidase
MSTSKSLRVALLQERDHGSVPANLDAIEAGLREAARGGAQLVLLQELHNGPYFCQHESVDEFERAETIPGPSTQRIGALAEELALVVVASLFERRAAGLYHNTAVVFDRKKEICGRYRKMHIPDDPAYYEKFYFTPGDLGFAPVATSLGKLGVLVCWDQWYPEAARLTALRGPNVLFYPTAIGWHPSEKKQWGASQVSAWQTIQRSHAIANGIYVASVNRIGHEGPKGGGIEFFGASFIADPYGRMIAEASNSKPEVLVAEVDPKTVETARQHWPFLRDRRIDAYGAITERSLEKK